jgi:hypothetical protein
MTDVGEPFPQRLIPVSDAFDQVYRAINPDFEILEERLNPAAKYYDAFQERDAKDRAHREALRSYDQAQRRAKEWLWDRMSHGILIALVWDLEKKEEYQIRRHRWASMGDFEMMDVFETGIAKVRFERRSIVTFERRSIFFNRNEFGNVLSKIAQPATGIDRPRVIDKGGRPPEYNWDAIKEFTLQQIAVLGKPHKDNRLLPSKTQLVELIQAEWSEKYDQHLGYTTVRDRLNRWLAETGEN